MVAVALALAASLAWGTSDYLGGVGARMQRLPVVLAGSQLVGLVAFAPVLFVLARPAPPVRDLAVGFAAGVVAAGELALIYVALRRGPAVVMAPIAASGAVLPVVVGWLGGEPAGRAIIAGIGCALAGSVAASWPAGEARPARRTALRAAAVAAGAALGTGTVLVLIDAASAADPWWTVGAVRCGGAVTAVGGFAVAVIMGRTRGPGRGRSGHCPAGSAATRVTIAAIGMSDVAADLCFANATRGGSLAVVSVLSSLYPVATIALAALARHDRPSRIQLAGVVLAGVGVAILSASPA